ncbi:hypothetical protein [Corallococcus sp. M7]
MIVSRGDDSNTWNALAGAWNASRQGWLSLVHGVIVWHLELAAMLRKAGWFSGKPCD